MITCECGRRYPDSDQRLVYDEFHDVHYCPLCEPEWGKIGECDCCGRKAPLVFKPHWAAGAAQCDTSFCEMCGTPSNEWTLEQRRRLFGYA